MGLIAKLNKRIETSYCSYMTVLIKMRFEFTPFFNLQNVVKNRIHFNTSQWGLRSDVFILFLFTARWAYN